MSQAAECLREPKKSEFIKEFGMQEWLLYKQFFEKLAVITSEIIVTKHILKTTKTQPFPILTNFLRVFIF